MKFLVVSQNAQEREEMKTLLRQLDRRAQTSDVRDWLQARRALSHEPRDLLLCDLGSTSSQAEALRLIDEHRGTLLLAGTCRDMPQQQILDLMRGGVKAVMLQSMGMRAMLRALELVLLGTHYIPPSAISLQSVDIASQEVAERRLPYRRRGFGDTPLLSPRQQQIMRLVHMGSTNKGIARALGISEGTVKIHLATVFKTLGASNRAAAVAIYNGWLFEQLDGSRASASMLQPARLTPQHEEQTAIERRAETPSPPLLGAPSTSALGPTPALPQRPAPGRAHDTSPGSPSTPESILATPESMLAAPSIREHGSPYGFRPGHPPGAPQGPPRPPRPSGPPQPHHPGPLQNPRAPLPTKASPFPPIEPGVTSSAPVFPRVTDVVTATAAPALPMPPLLPTTSRPTLPAPSPFRPPRPRTDMPGAPWPSTSAANPAPHLPALDEHGTPLPSDQRTGSTSCSPFPAAVPDGGGTDAGSTGCPRPFPRIG